MRRLFPYLLVLLVFAPVNFTAGYLGGKPLDFVPADLLLLLVPLVVFYLGRFKRDRLVKSYTLALSLYLLYCVFDILVLQFQGEGGLLSTASFVRAIRPFALFYVGFMLFSWSRGRAERWALQAALALAVILLLSDMAYSPHFPNPRWGGYFLGAEVYGFPNSPGFFYVVTFCILLSEATRTGANRVLYGPVAALAALIVVFVGSRNALASILMAVALLLYFRYLDRRYIFGLVPLMVAGFFVTSAAEVDMGMLATKAQRTMDEGVLYGRLGVWGDVLGVVMERPLLGYGFEPLTENYAYHGTAHNQYIEYLYKTGIVGTILVGFVWFSVYRALVTASRHARGGQERRFYAFMAVAFLACLLSNFAQPNLSYSITQTLFVFFAGVAAARVNRQNREMEDEAGNARLDERR